MHTRPAPVDAFIWQSRAGKHDKAIQVGDHVSWNSEAGRVSGRIVKVHTRNVDYKGYVHHASKDEPQYEIKSDKTDHVALHKGAALTRLRR
jgi:predicted thioesterase